MYDIAVTISFFPGSAVTTTTGNKSYCNSNANYLSPPETSIIYSGELVRMLWDMTTEAGSSFETNETRADSHLTVKTSLDLEMMQCIPDTPHVSDTPILNLDVFFQINEQGSSADLSVHNDSALGASETTIQDQSENFCELGITGAASAFELWNKREWEYLC